jgi:hypothetical protein
MESATVASRRTLAFLKQLTTGGKSEEGNKGSLSQVDQEQVKPGAGIVPGEVPVDEDTEETPPLTSARSQNNKSLKRNFTSLFGLKKPSLPPPAGDRGRFIEDVDPPRKLLE